MTEITALSEDTTAAAREAVFAKLGRNIVLFQQLESGFKAFITHRVIEGSSPEEVEQLTTRRRESVATQPLGKVVSRFLEEISGRADDSTDESDVELPPGCPGRFRTTFRIDGDNYVAEKQDVLKRLVDERNRLVHHLLDDFDLRQQDDLQRLEVLLDAQAERVRAELGDLREVVTALDGARKAMAEYIGSPQHQEIFDLLWLQQSAAIQQLLMLSDEIARPDGWTVLPLAAWRIRERAPDALDNMKARYGHSSLKAMLLASALFDLKEEATARGVRVLYRPRSNNPVAE